jgi:hypothetical protein
MNALSQVRFIEVWRTLGGPEIRSGRAPAWWWGSRDPNVSIDPERGAFYDHVQNRGGEVLVLVETVLNCDRAHALAWLGEEGFIESRHLSREERREYARRKSQATSASVDIGYWRRAFIPELNARKLTAVQVGDDEALGRAASLCNALKNGSPADTIREFIRH